MRKPYKRNHIKTETAKAANLNQFWGHEYDPKVYDQTVGQPFHAAQDLYKLLQSIDILLGRVTLAASRGGDALQPGLIKAFKNDLWATIDSRLK